MKSAAVKKGHDWPPLSRSFDIASRLLRGESLDVQRLVDLYGVSPRQAYRILTEAERLLPVQVLPGNSGLHGHSMRCRLMDRGRI